MDINTTRKVTMETIDRRSGEKLYIYPDYSKIRPSTTIGEMFGADGCLTIRIEGLSKKSAIVGYDTPEGFATSRAEE